MFFIRSSPSLEASRLHTGHQCPRTTAPGAAPPSDARVRTPISSGSPRFDMFRTSTDCPAASPAGACARSQSASSPADTQSTKHHERFSRLEFPTRDQHHTETCSRLCCPRRPLRDKPHCGYSLVHVALPGRPYDDTRAHSLGPSKCDTMHPARSRYRKSPIRVQQHTGNDSALSVSCSRSTNTCRLSLLPRLACASSHPDPPCASNVAPSHRARTKSLFADSRQSSRKRALPYIRTGVVCLGPRTPPKDSGRRRGARADGFDEVPRRRDTPDTGPVCRTDRSRIGLIRVPCDIEIDTARANLSILIPATSVHMDEEPLAFASTDRVTTLLLRKIPFVGLPAHRGPQVDNPQRMILTSYSCENRGQPHNAPASHRVVAKPYFSDCEMSSPKSNPFNLFRSTSSLKFSDTNTVAGFSFRRNISTPSTRLIGTVYIAAYPRSHAPLARAAFPPTQTVSFRNAVPRRVYRKRYQTSRCTARVDRKQSEFLRHRARLGSVPQSADPARRM